MAKKVWTAAARKAFAAKMKRARAAKRGRRKNPTKAQVKDAAARIGRAAAKLAWRGAKLTGRAGKAGAKAAAAEVKASICRVRKPNPKRWTAAARAAFARRMARYRKHPKRKAIRRRRSNPFRVVIKAVPKGEYRGKRRKNPTTPLYYDGKNFSSVRSRRKTFSSVQPAEVVARQLLHRYPVLKKGYVVTLNSV